MRDGRIDVRVAAHVDICHAAHFKQLDFGSSILCGCRLGVGQFRRTLRVGPVEHLDPIDQGLLGGGRRTGRPPEDAHQ